MTWQKQRWLGRLLWFCLSPGTKLTKAWALKGMGVRVNEGGRSTF
jgi:hypothetical protein